KACSRQRGPRAETGQAQGRRKTQERVQAGQLRAGCAGDFSGFCPVNRVGSLVANASITRSRLPSWAALPILPKTKRSRPREAGKVTNKKRGEEHGAELAQAISRRRRIGHRSH